MAEEGSVQELVPQGTEENNLLKNRRLLENKTAIELLLPEGEKLTEAVDSLNSNIPFLTELANTPSLSDFEKATVTIGEFFEKYDMLFKFPGMKAESNLHTEINRFADFGLSFLDNNLGRIDNNINTLGLESQENLMSAVVYLGKFGKGEGRKKAIDFLLNHFESITREESESDKIKMGKDISGVWSRFERFGEKVPILHTILEFGNTSQVEAGKQMITRLLKDSDPTVKKLVAYTIPLWIADMDPRRKLTEDILSSLGINGQEAVTKWKSALFKHRSAERISFSKNLLSLLSLEETMPGIGKILQSEFGINDFARYPKDLLIAQCNERNITDNIPYGLIIYPEYDHNGAFYKDVDVFQGLFEQLKGKYRIRVFEIESPLGLLNTLNRSRHKYGKISFAIIGGHGTKEDIRFGGLQPLNENKPKKRDLLAIGDIKRTGAFSVKNAFIDNPTIILSSCSTGKLGGIGQELSNIGGRIIGPSNDTNFENIDANISNSGEIRFSVKYTTGTTANTYASGASEINTK